MSPAQFEKLLNRYGGHEAGSIASGGDGDSVVQPTVTHQMEDLEALQLKTLLALHQQSSPEAAGKVFPSLPPQALALHTSLMAGMYREI